MAAVGKKLRRDSLGYTVLLISGKWSALSITALPAQQSANNILALGSIYSIDLLNEPNVFDYYIHSLS